MQTFIKIHPLDNVVVALKEIPQGTTLTIFPPKSGDFKLPAADSVIQITTTADIPAGHKIAVTQIPAGSPIIKYGSRIGFAKETIHAGDWVHVHNIKTGLGELLEYTYDPVSTNGWLPDKQLLNQLPASFLGFPRSDGQVGVRNEIWIIPTVGCVNNVASAVAKQAGAFLKGSVEDVVAFPHPYGCSQMGEDQENSRRILADLIKHPNAGGVLVLGLGCENSGVEILKSYLGDYDKERIRFLVAQECEDEIEAALEIIKQLIDQASLLKREPVSTKKLVVGLKCGGSDGLSGITANPLVGRFSDLLIANGGSALLTEVPEMFGAETLLMNRCETEALFHQTVSLINDFKNYFKSHNQTIYENPSPGNKKGGISTLEDKSLGCTQKSGSSPVKGVLAYGERIRVPGLNLLNAPGNDLVAATALAAAGAQIILFTTGRGTPFASPVPTVKIATNSTLAQKKSNWIDFNAGVLAEGETIDTVTKTFYQTIIDIASGKKVCSELAGYHDMAIFKQGVTL